MQKYNPQIEVQINEILPDGSDIPFEVDFFSGEDKNHHAGNRPINIAANVTNSLGGTQNFCSLTISNPLYIETFRKNPQAEINKFKGKKLRIRVWAWYDDNGVTTKGPQPFDPPVFVGDALNGFTISADDINDAQIQIQAQGHSWLASSGKYKKTWEGGQTYLDVVNDIMLEIVENRGQGQELDGSAPRFIVDDFLEQLVGKELPLSFTVNRNPIEVLNDICRELDYVWGVHNNIPYIVSRKHPFQPDFYPTNSAMPEEYSPIDYQTGLISNISYGIDNFTFRSLHDRELFIGRVVTVTDAPQTNPGGTIVNGIVVAPPQGADNTAVPGRITEISSVFDNQRGHSMNCTCSYLVNFTKDAPTEAEVVLPERRANNSGLRAE